MVREDTLVTHSPAGLGLIVPPVKDRGVGGVVGEGRAVAEGLAVGDDGEGNWRGVGVGTTVGG